MDDRRHGCRRARRATTGSSSGRRGSSPPRPSSRSSTAAAPRRRSTACSARSTSRRCAHALRRAASGGGATVDPTAPAKGPGDKDPNEPAFTVRVVVTDAPATAARTARCCSPTATRPRPTRRTSGPAARHRSACSTSTATTSSTRCSPTRAASCTSWRPTARRSRASTTASRCRRSSTRTSTPARRRFTSVEPAARGAAHARDRRHRRRPRARDRGHGRRARLRLERRRHRGAGLPGAARPGAVAAAGPHAQQPHQARLHGSPMLGDLNDDDVLEIVVTAALDQHVYAWDGDGNAIPGFPKKLRDPDASPAPRSSRRAALGDITGDGRARHRHPDPGVRRQPVRAADAGGARRRASATSSPTSSPTCSAAAAARTRSTRGGDTCFRAGRRRPNGVVPDALPLVGPGVDHMMANVDGDPELEAIGNLATGDVTATNGDGSNAVTYDSSPAGGEHVDKSKVLNLFENPIAANIDGAAGARDHQGRRHAEPARQHRRRHRPEPALQPRRPGLERARPAPRCRRFPQAVEDFQLLSSPIGRRRLRRTRQRDPGRHRPLLPAQHQRDRSRGHRLAQVHRRLDLRDARRSATPTATATSTSPRSRARATRSRGTRTAPPAARTTSGGPPATTSGTRAPTAPTAARPARRGTCTST